APWPEPKQFNRQMLILDGCVQPSATPQTNAATARLLAQFDIGLTAPVAAGCCGALSRHLAAGDEATAYARANIDTWWPYIEAGAEAIVITASGCGAEVADYGYILRNDPQYADKAARVSALTRDLSDVLAQEDIGRLAGIGHGRKIAYHPPCTLQNAPALKDHVAEILRRAGFELTPVADKHLCCGSAGTYSLLQPEIAGQLRSNKLAALGAGQPETIVTANIEIGRASCRERGWISGVVGPCG